MKKPNLVERRRAANARAMPEVKKLVKKFGRTAVSSCMTKIIAAEKATKKLVAMKRAVAEFESKLR
jgi:N-methylhydantoinase B/oxoprolinase/acetone carboxylase alpha subunit